MGQQKLSIKVYPDAITREAVKPFSLEHQLKFVGGRNEALADSSSAAMTASVSPACRVLIRRGFGLGFPTGRARRLYARTGLRPERQRQGALQCSS
jgi:hypothetical protein